MHASSEALSLSEISYRTPICKTDKRGLALFEVRSKGLRVLV